MYLAPGFPRGSDADNHLALDFHVRDLRPLVAFNGRVLGNSHRHSRRKVLPRRSRETGQPVENNSSWIATEPRLCAGSSPPSDPNKPYVFHEFRRFKQLLTEISCNWMEGRFRQQRLHTPHPRRDQGRVRRAAPVSVQREFSCSTFAFHFTNR